MSSVTRSSDTCLIHWNTVRAIYILSNFIHDPESDDATSRLDSFLLNSDTNGTRARCLSGRQEGAKLYCFSKLDCFCGKNFSPPWNRLGILNFKHFFSHFTVWYEEPGTEFCGKLFSGFLRYLWTKYLWTKYLWTKYLWTKLVVAEARRVKSNKLCQSRSLPPSSPS